MQNRPLNNEEKLDMIYRILSRQERARLFSQRLRIAKWILIGTIAIVAIKYPEPVIGSFTRYLQPIVMNSMSGIIADQKTKSLEEIQNILKNQSDSSY